MKYAGQTIIGIAHWRGARKSIKTKKAAWKYLLSHMEADTTPLEKRGKRISANEYTSYLRNPNIFSIYSHDAEGRKLFQYDRWAERLERRDKNIFKGKKYIPRYIKENGILRPHLEYKEKMLNTITWNLGNTYSISTLPQRPQDWADSDWYLCVAGRTILLHRDDRASWANAKSRWPSSRSIVRSAYLLEKDWDSLGTEALFRNANNEEGLKSLAIERSVKYEARGQWLHKIIIELLRIAPEAAKGHMHIQLDPHFRISRKRKIAGIEIWQRTLAGEVVDYCAVRGKDTYHARTPREAVHGLAAKLAAPGSRREILDMKYALSLGFCRQGVEQFCDDYGLNPEASYSRQELQEVIARGNGLKEKYHNELVKAGLLP